MTDHDIERLAREAGFTVEVGAIFAEADDGPTHVRVSGQLARFAALIAAHERERWIAKAGQVYTDAHAIFNDPPSETPQEVRDVIEWHLSSMRAGE